MGEMNQLKLARKIIQQSEANIHKNEELQNEIGLDDYILNLIASNVCSTIGIQFNEIGDVLITQVANDITKLVTFPNYTEDGYWDFCCNTLKINRNEQYNCSISAIIKGVRTRIYAVMPPLVKTATITISTTKTPPNELNNKTIDDSLWDKIVHSNFIVVGASGSGKTYLTNYLLNKFIGKDERIAFIEEFGELIPPNRHTITITVPPPKPNEESLLKYITQQSNLMRLDAFYVGEVKGPEAWPMIVNMASGTRGGCTLHGETAEQALNRLRALCQQSCDNNEAIDEFIAKSIKYIIVMRKRRIIAIKMLTGTHVKNSFSMQDIYKLENT